MSNTDPYYMTGFQRVAAGGVDVPDNTLMKTDGNGLTMQATDITISDAEVMTFPSGGKVYVDTIADRAGTGAPSFSMGIAVAASKDVTLGASGKFLGDTIADRAGTGAPAFSMGLSVAASKVATVAGYLTFTSVTASALGSGILTFPAGGSLIKLASETVNLDGILAASSSAGRVVVLLSPATGTVTIRDAQSVGSDKAFALGAATRALTGNSSWVGVYDGTVWQELAFSVNT